MKDLFGEETVRTLGLYQPFATLMGHGKIETRWVQAGRMAPFPEGTYLLYSTQKAYTDNEFGNIAGEWAADGWELAWQDDTLQLDGYALWVGKLVKRSYLQPNERMNAFVGYPSQYFDGSKYYSFNEKGDPIYLWGLHFENVKRIKPFIFKGKQGVGILTKEQKELIEFV